MTTKTQNLALGESKKSGRVNLLLGAKVDEGDAADIPMSVPESVTWTDLVDDWKAFLTAGRAPKTVRAYLDRLAGLRRWAEGQGIGVCAFRGRNLTKYLAGRVEAGISPTTRRHDAVVAKMFFAWAAKDDYLPGNPLADYKVAKAPKPFVRMPSDDEIRRLLRALDERWSLKTNPNARFMPPASRQFYLRRNRAIVSGLIETAMRGGEMLALRLEDFSVEKKQVAVRVAKGQEPRLVPMSTEWIEIVQAYLKKRPACKSEYLFVTAFGTPMDLSNFSGDFRGYMAFAGLSGFSLHGLRHYAITELSKENVWAASQIAGHKDMKTTMGYLHSSMEHVRQTHADAAPLARLLTNTRSEKARRRKLI